jgi:hypothetical protein
MTVLAAIALTPEGVFVGALITALVATLLAQELLRAGEAAPFWVRALDLFVTPLLILFGVVVVGRLAMLAA